MSIATIVTRGFSTGSNTTSVAELVTVGYAIGEPVVFPTCDIGGYSRIFNFPTGAESVIQNLSGGESAIVQLSGGYSRIINISTGGESTIEQNSGGESPLCQ